MYMRSQNKETITLAGGCFWCTEAIFRRLKGVDSVVSGYAGGNIENPTDAEAVQIEFDPQVISFEEILEVFWHLVDPTTLNQQGADVGTEYRSIIFYGNEKQKKIAEKSKEETEKSKMYQDSIVTEILPLRNFYKAEDYNQNFFEKNIDKPYCQIVINPKIEKLIKEFGEKVKAN